MRSLHASAAAALREHPWRGNVRELRNAVFRLALMAREDVVDAQTVAEVLGHSLETAEAVGKGGFDEALALWLGEQRPADGALYHTALAAFERPLFEHALRRTGGNQLRAAKLLGINRNTLRKKLGELAIEPDRFTTER